MGRGWFWAMVVCATVGLLGATNARAESSATKSSSEAGWVSLFDGRSLAGWKAAENLASFRVLDGTILADGPRAHLFYVGSLGDASFRSFELKLEARTQPGANSGVFFHTRFQDQGWPREGFEVQINNSQPQQGEYLELKKTGSLYGIRNVLKSLVADDEWFELHVTVTAGRVQVRLNGTLVVDYREPATPMLAGDVPVNRLGAGTFALQGHDPASRVAFRNLRVRPLAEPTASSPEAARVPVGPDALESQRLALARDNFPLADLHVHLKGGLTLAEALERSHRDGVFLGVAVNCGVGFPITDDAGARAFLETQRGQPVFVAMQAEGREWVTMFSSETRRAFDYVFTDALTFTDARGKRTRLWIPEEVEIGDEQAFMDTYTDRIVGVLRDEPIDVYVNATMLPAVLADRYDMLWTPERMRRIVEAAAAKHVAIEISGPRRVPSERFLRLAKEAGIKLTFGSNNADRNLSDLAYCLEMQRALGLTWRDMFVPPSRVR